MSMETPEWLTSAPKPKEGLEALNIEEQWASQVKTLLKLGIIDTFPGSGGKLGIKGINSMRYLVPQLEDIKRRLEAKKEIVEKKMEQGFTKIILVPFALPLDFLIQKYREALLKHSKEGKLFNAKEHPNIKSQQIAVDTDEPLRVWFRYNRSDVGNKLLYFPEMFSDFYNNGKTKTQLLSGDNANENAWMVLLVEDIPGIPMEGMGRKIGGRRQVENNKTPREYLKLLQTDPQYVNESGLTPEMDIMLALTRLEEKNEVASDPHGKGSFSFQIGAYFLNASEDGRSETVPCSCWNSIEKKALLAGYDSGDNYTWSGARFGVKV